MAKINLQKIKFHSFLKLNCLINCIFGFTAGLLLFLLSLSGKNVYADLGFVRFTGVSAGVTVIFLLPAVSAFSGLLIALISYLPFKLYLKMFKKISLEGDFEVFRDGGILTGNINDSENKKANVIENKKIDDIEKKKADNNQKGWVVICK